MTQQIASDRCVVQGAVTFRELLAVALMVILADVAIYRGGGMAGLAALFALGPALLLFGKTCPQLNAGFWIVSVMLFAISARMLWLGSTLAGVVGFFLLAALSVTAHGVPPAISRVLAVAASVVLAGILRFVNYCGLSHYRPRLNWPFPLSISLPAAVVLLFASLFVLANPDVVSRVFDVAERALRWFDDLLRRWSEYAPEWAFLMAAACIAAGLLRPIVLNWLGTIPLPVSSGNAAEPIVEREAPLYVPLRNTLISVAILFAIYLVFEFRTLWFRSFPKGFYYAGYAHQGAAWLTAALAMVSLVLSFAFRGSVLHDPRLTTLRRLAWLWSIENLALALAVYHRMYIYVEFNGMTRMRTIGLFGITAVVLGFGMALWKIIYHRDFPWLIRHQAWALAVVIFLYAVTPVDALVYRYNTRQILDGDLAASVQISVHPIDAEGVLQLIPLVHCGDTLIREGVQAMLAQRASEVEEKLFTRQARGWTYYQAADQSLWRSLAECRREWQSYADPAKRAAVLERFHQYVYQWY